MKHLYKIGKSKAGILKTESAIALPERRTDLKKALKECEFLGNTPDGKSIYLYTHTTASPIMREIGRLRVCSFRAVDEGTGKHRDIDQFDSHYLHLILWDPEDLEISGAYRFTSTKKAVTERGIDDLYTSTLF